MRERLVSNILLIVLFFEVILHFLFSVVSTGAWEQNRTAWEASMFLFIIQSFWYSILLTAYFLTYQWLFKKEFPLDKTLVIIHLSLIVATFSLKVLPVPFPFSYFAAMLLKYLGIFVFIILLWTTWRGSSLTEKLKDEALKNAKQTKNN